MCELDVAAKMILGAVVGAPLGAVGGALARVTLGPVGICAGATWGIIVGGCTGLMMDSLCERGSCAWGKVLIVAMAALALVSGAWGLVGFMGFPVTVKSAVIATIPAVLCVTSLICIGIGSVIVSMADADNADRIRDDW